jgi:uncharacterized membrane protein
MKNPIKPTIKTELVPLLFILLGLVLSLYFYTLFPERVATHWNATGEVDGYSGKAFAAFFFPILNIAIYLLMLFVPFADPRKKNYDKFKGVYHIVKGALVVFMSTIYIVLGLNGLGINMPVALITPIAVGLLFIVIGSYLGKVKPNWFFGIRTPWTLSSNKVWKKTHIFGGKVFILGGIFMILTVIFPSLFGWFIGLFIAMILSIIIYSYVIYRK